MALRFVSPTIGNGVAISGITTDYFGTAQTTPTIGAVQYVGAAPGIFTMQGARIQGRIK